MEQVTWFCSKCPQDDIVSHRSIDKNPKCPACGEVHTWSQLAYLGDDQDAYLDALDELARKKYGKVAVDLVEAEDDSAVHCLQDSFNSSVLPETALDRLINLNIRNKCNEKADKLEIEFNSMPDRTNEDYLKKQSVFQEMCRHYEWAEFQHIASNPEWEPSI